MKSNILKSPVMQPHEMNAAFAAAYNSGDLDKALALFEPYSIHIHPNGEIEQGIDVFRNTLNDFLKHKGKLVSNNVYCIPFEDIALLRAHYILETIDENGMPVRFEGHTAEVARRQPDGSWKYIIDHPFGADSLTRLQGS